jgi:arylsulfatase A-like enzyme
MDAGIAEIAGRGRRASRDVEVAARAWAGLFLISVVASGCAPSYDGPAKHVVFISLDTTRADHFGFYGNERVKTPRLDALAAESIVFDDFMTVVPTTLASHASLFSGKYPQSHGTPRNGFQVNDENVMLAELLGERGFVTAGFVASFPLEHRFGIAQGFQHYDDRFDLLAHEAAVLQDERSASAVTDAVIEYIDGESVPRNLFLFAHYFDAHAPYEPPPPFDTLYDPRGGEGLPAWSEVLEMCRAGGPTEVFERTALQYAGEISYVDEQVGRLLDALRERGILDEALIVVTSDHGELFTEHPETVCFDHGWMTYQPDTRAVGLIRLPGGAGGGIRVTELVASTDLLPSVLRYLGIPEPAGVDGEAFDLERPGEIPAGRARFAQATKPWETVETDPRWKNMRKARSVRLGQHKLTQVPYAGFEALYDLERDPDEQRNLLDEPSADTAQLASELRVLLETWAGSAQPLPSEFVTSQQEEVLERLRALGYADP